MTAARAVAAATLAATATALLAASPSAGGPQAARLTVFAAASLTEVFPRIDSKPAYNFGGSNQLAFHIRRGAPADVFASASPAYTQELFRRGLLERPRTFASNSLVLAVPHRNPARLRTVFDVRRRGVRLVIGTPQVPAGAYARAVLKRLGLTTALANVVSEEPDVKGIVGKLALGEADAGFVYATDVKATRGRLAGIAIPARGRPAVRYEIAVVKSSESPAAARRWVDAVVTGKRAEHVLKQAGFRAR